MSNVLMPLCYLIIDKRIFEKCNYGIKINTLFAIRPITEKITSVRVFVKRNDN